MQSARKNGCRLYWEPPKEKRTYAPMKLCRFQPRVVPADKVGTTAHPEVLQGVISGETVREISGDLLARWSVTNRSWPLTDVKLLPPVLPSKIVCLGRNYVEHAAEFNNPTPKQPLIFLKPPSSLLAPEDPIVLPPAVGRVDYEGELAVIISKECSQLQDGDDIRPFIAGYTCLNDVSARDYQALDKQWTRAKSFDTFCPLGPFLETEFDVSHGTIETLLNGVTTHPTLIDKEKRTFREHILEIANILKDGVVSAEVVSF